MNKTKYMIEFGTHSKCGECTLSYIAWAGEDRCSVLFKNVDHSVTLEDCPFKELKPKQLVWTRSDDFFTHTSTPHENMVFMFRQYLSGNSYTYLNDKQLGKYTNLKNSELMEICQEQYNKFFTEMIGAGK